MPFVVPNVLGDARPAAAWGDAATIVPWVLHERYADVADRRAPVPEHEGLGRRALELAGDRVACGRACSSSATGSTPMRRRTCRREPRPTPTSSRQRVPLPLGGCRRPRGGACSARTTRPRQYAAIAEEVRTAFLAEYVTPVGRMMSDAQTAYAMAIVFDIAPADQQHGARCDRLAELTRLSGYRIGTGFVGTPIIQDALTPHRAPRHRAAPARADREPVVAVPGDDGCDDDLGALGLDAAGRLDQPGRDDVVQPLRARRDRRLAAPRRRGSGPRCARLRADPHRSRTRSPSFDYASAEHLTPYGTARAGWTRRDGVGPHRGRRPAEHDGGRRASRRAQARGRARAATSGRWRMPRRRSPPPASASTRRWRR